MTLLSQWDVNVGFSYAFSLHAALVDVLFAIRDLTDPIDAVVLLGEQLTHATHTIQAENLALAIKHPLPIYQFGDFKEERTAVKAVCVWSQELVRLIQDAVPPEDRIDVREHLPRWHVEPLVFLASEATAFANNLRPLELCRLSLEAPRVAELSRTLLDEKAAAIREVQSLGEATTEYVLHHVWLLNLWKSKLEDMLDWKRPFEEATWEALQKYDKFYEMLMERAEEEVSVRTAQLRKMGGAKRLEDICIKANLGFSQSSLEELAKCNGLSLPDFDKRTAASLADALEPKLTLPASPGAISQTLIIFSQPEAHQSLSETKASGGEQTKPKPPHAHEQLVPMENLVAPPQSNRTKESNESQSGMISASLERIGPSWHLQFGEEKGIFPATQYSAMMDLAILLAQPCCSLDFECFCDQETLALVRSPERNEDTYDRTYLRQLEKELQDIREMPQSESTDARFAEIAKAIDEAVRPGGKAKKLGRSAADRKWDALTKGLERLYKRMATDGMMPLLAEHLRKTIAANKPNFLYRKPANVRWVIAENS